LGKIDFDMCDRCDAIAIASSLRFLKSQIYLLRKTIACHFRWNESFFSWGVGFKTPKGNNHILGDHFNPSIPPPSMQVRIQLSKENL